LRVLKHECTAGKVAGGAHADRPRHDRTSETDLQVSSTSSCRLCLSGYTRLAGGGHSLGALELASRTVAAELPDSFRFELVDR